MTNRDKKNNNTCIKGNEVTRINNINDENFVTK